MAKVVLNRAWTLVTTCLLGNAILALATSCGEGAADATRPACVPVDATPCRLAYAPEYDVLFERIFLPTCASAGGACHGGNGQGGLSFVDAGASYDLLLAAKSGGARVKPRDAACSELVVRLDSIGHSWSMPPADPLDEELRCSIRRWIQQGAQRMP